MNTKKINNFEFQDFPSLKTSISSEEARPKRVDINDLLTRARKKNDRENLGNIVFFGFFVAVICTVGIILSF